MGRGSTSRQGRGSTGSRGGRRGRGPGGGQKRNITKPALNDLEILECLDSMSQSQNTNTSASMLFEQEDVDEILEKHRQPITDNFEEHIEITSTSQTMNDASDSSDSGEVLDVDFHSDQDHRQPYTVPKLPLDDVHILSSDDEHFTLDAETPRRRRRRQHHYLRRDDRANRLGRSQDVIWDSYFTKRDLNNKIISNLCGVCKTEVSPQAGRMRTHLAKHTDAAKLSKEPATITKSLATVHASTSDVSPASGQTTNSQLTKSFPRQQKLGNWVDRISKDEKEVIDLRVARCIFGANLPFALVKNPLFANLLQSLKPSYVLPSAKVLGSTLLDKIYEEAVSLMKTSLGSKTAKVTLMQDGWTTNQNVPVISHSFSTVMKSYFLDAVTTGTATKSAKYCLDQFIKAWEMVTSQFNCQVIAFIIDNAETMNCLRREINGKFPDIYVVGCQSHLLNLLGEEIAPKDLVRNIVEVQKYFRNHHFESAALKEKKGSRPVLPANTRWNSNLDCCKSFIENQAKYLEISRMPKSTLPEFLLATIQNSKTYDLLQKSIQLMQPVAIAIDELQSETSTLADAMHHWIKLGCSFGETGNPITQESYLKRQNQAVVPVMVAAYMLHPIYKGKKLLSEHSNIGYKFLEQKNPFYVAAALRLSVSDNTLYPETHLNPDITKHLNCTTWWKTLNGHGSITENLIDFAVTILSIPASTGSLERYFSTLTDIITKKRNRLQVDKAKKLCTIYRTFGEQFYDNEKVDFENADSE